jgi:hypothetical protein
MKERFDAFLKAWETRLKTYYSTETTLGAEYISVSSTEGKKYWKILRKAGGSTCAVGFVDKATGEIFKSASFNAPAKWSRGSILADDLGLSCMTNYGPEYLRR